MSHGGLRSMAPNPKRFQEGNEMLAENNKMGRFAVLAVGVIFVIIGFMGDKPIENRILTLLVGGIFFIASRYAQDTSFEGSIVLDEDEHEDNENTDKSEQSN